MSAGSNKRNPKTGSAIKPFVDEEPQIESKSYQRNVQTFVAQTADSEIFIPKGSKHLQLT